MDSKFKLDVFKSASNINSQKCAVLHDIANLFDVVSSFNDEVSKEDIKERAASLIKDVYILCESLGINSDSLSLGVSESIKIDMTNGSKKDLSKILKTFTKKG